MKTIEQILEHIDQVVSVYTELEKFPDDEEHWTIIKSSITTLQALKKFIESE